MIAGDTVPCDGLDELCRGADVYVQTVLRDDSSQVPIQRFLDMIDYHSTVVQAAQTAHRRRAHAGADPPGPDARRRIRRRVGRDRSEHFAGEIVFGRDLSVVPVGAG